MNQPDRHVKQLNRHEYFVKRLHDLGMFGKDSDYDGEIGRVVEAMSEAFSSYGHSGMSAEMTIQLFNKLMTEWETQELK